MGDLVARGAQHGLRALGAGAGSGRAGVPDGSWTPGTDEAGAADRAPTAGDGDLAEVREVATVGDLASVGQPAPGSLVVLMGPLCSRTELNDGTRARFLAGNLRP